MAPSRPRVGIGYRPVLAAWVDSGPAGLQCLEVTAEDFYKSGGQRLRMLARRYPLLARSTRLSVGSAGPLSDEEVGWLAAVVSEARPLWISEPLGFRRSAEVDLGHPCPVRPDAETLALLVAHACRLAEACGTRVLLENITAHFHLRGTMSEPELINRACEEAGCGVLLDITSLLVSARSQAFEARAWLADLDPRNVVAMRVGSHARVGGRCTDARDGRVQEDVWELATEVGRMAPIEAAILTRDSAFPHTAELEAELARLDTCLRPATPGGEAAAPAGATA